MKQNFNLLYMLSSFVLMTLEIYFTKVYTNLLRVGFFTKKYSIRLSIIVKYLLLTWEYFCSQLLALTNYFFKDKNYSDTLFYKMDILVIVHEKCHIFFDETFIFYLHLKPFWKLKLDELLSNKMTLSSIWKIMTSVILQQQEKKTAQQLYFECEILINLEVFVRELPLKFSLKIFVRRLPLKFNQVMYCKYIIDLCRRWLD